MSPTIDWLRARSDDELTALLTARRDLLVPAPPDLAALARRMDGAATVRRAVGQLDECGVKVLQALWLIAEAGSGKDHPVAATPGGDASSEPDDVAAFLGGPASAADITATTDHLHTLGLVRHIESGYVLGPAVRESFGHYPAGLGMPTGLSPKQVSTALASIDDEAQALLDRLVPGPPVGTVEKDSTHGGAINRLVKAGLLTQRDPQSVLLPREVALALRGSHPLGPALSQPPPLRTTHHRAGTVDGTAAAQALTAHNHSVSLLKLIGTHPLPALKTGGIGIVALRRIAKELNSEIHMVALHLEILHAAGMISPTASRSSAAPRWLPTQATDTFLASTEATGWAVLATTWLDMRREPVRVGTRDAAGKICNALSTEIDWRTGPAERRDFLREIASCETDVGADPGSVAERLSYRHPLRSSAAIATRVAAVLGEATELGLVAFDALATPGRNVLDDDVEAAAAAMQQILPAPVDSVVVQADMTVIAPGRLTPELARDLARVAEVESEGSATVYRISEASLRRGFDAGMTRTQLHELLTQHSVTPIPQSMTYLIDDVARKHGVLRSGSASAYLHSEDAALIAQAVAAAAKFGIVLRTLAPTVAVGSVEVDTLVELLRDAGVAVAAEDADGSILDLRPTPQRTRATLPPRPRYIEPSAPSSEQISAVIRRMRGGDQSQSSPQQPVDIVAVLREAVGARSAVWIQYADAQGSVSRRIVEPIVASGGTMVAFDRFRQAPQTFAIHRIRSVDPDESDDTS